MSLNIIVKGGKRSGMSGDEMARYLSKKVEAEARREKAGYKQRALAARKYGQVCWRREELPSSPIRRCYYLLET